MDEYTMTEQAYKNGYEQGLKDAAKEGKWEAINKDGSWRVDRCSACPKETPYVRYAPPYDYCPNCGARMKG